MQPRITHLLLTLAAALAPLPAAAGTALQGIPTALEAPTELFEVARVVDGDTLHIVRGGELQKLRLLSVDTEEKLTGNPNASPTKPETVFGEECALWAQEFFEGLAPGEDPPRVGLRFPDDVERADIYGRLLCHVILPDGRDFNLLLVELGKSPYFNKYGNSRICHEAFVKAQDAAQKEELGIWNPATNTAAEKGAPEAKRPYERLLPWWQARAEAIDAFRAAHAEDPEGHVEAEDVGALEAAAAQGREVRVFGTPYRFFDEEGGHWTVLLRATDRDRALRVRIAAEHRAAFDETTMRRTVEEFRQNYVWVKGVVVETGRGFDVHCTTPAAWSLAGPEPGR